MIASALSITDGLDARLEGAGEMLSGYDFVRLVAVFTASGVFWMTIWFLVEKVSMKRPLPGSTVLAFVVLVVSAYALVEVVTGGAVSLLAQPRL
jgi:hypothetical protein